MLLRDKVLRVVAGLSVRDGASYATERYKRDAVGRRWHRPGERSVSRVERQLVDEGYLERERVLPGAKMPNGHRTRRGTTICRIVSRQVRRARARAAAKAHAQAARHVQRPPAPAAGTSWRRGDPSPRRSPPPRLDAAGGERYLSLEELATLAADVVRSLGPPD